MHPIALAPIPTQLIWAESVYLESVVCVCVCVSVCVCVCVCVSVCLSVCLSAPAEHHSTPLVHLLFCRTKEQREGTWTRGTKGNGYKPLFGITQCLLLGR